MNNIWLLFKGIKMDNEMQTNLLNMDFCVCELSLPDLHGCTHQIMLGDLSEMYQEIQLSITDLTDVKTCISLSS